MSKHSLIILFGILIAILPFVGIPTTWKTPLYVFFGLVAAGLAFVLRQERHNAEMAARERVGGNVRV